MAHAISCYNYVIRQSYDLMFPAVTMTILSDDAQEALLIKAPHSRGPFNEFLN